MSEGPEREYLLYVDPSETVDTDKLFAKREDQYKMMSELLINKAYNFVFTKPEDPTATEIQNALNNIKNGTDAQIAQATQFLFNRFGNKEFVDELMANNSTMFKGLDTDPRVKAMIAMSTPTQTTPPPASPTSTPSIPRVVTEQMVRVNPDLADYVGQTVQFVLNEEDGKYYPVLGE